MSQYPQPPQQYQTSPEQDRAYQIRQDGEYLQILSVLYYVMTGFACLSGCFTTMYLFIGFAMLGGAAAGNMNQDEAAGLAVMGGFISAIMLVAVVLTWTFAYCLYRTGRNLREARNPTFCFVMACLICLSIPFGTALGIFTIIVLNRPTVKERFAAYGGWQPPPEKQPPQFQQYG